MLFNAISSDQLGKLHILDVHLMSEPVVFLGDIACILKKNKDTLCRIVGTAGRSSDSLIGDVRRMLCSYKRS